MSGSAHKETSSIECKECEEPAAEGVHIPHEYSRVDDTRELTGSLKKERSYSARSLEAVNLTCCLTPWWSALITCETGPSMFCASDVPEKSKASDHVVTLTLVQ